MKQNCLHLICYHQCYAAVQYFNFSSHGHYLVCDCFYELLLCKITENVIK